jgi:hypothetical protein
MEVSFTPWPHYPSGKMTQYTFGRRSCVCSPRGSLCAVDENREMQRTHAYNGYTSKYWRMILSDVMHFTQSLHLTTPNQLLPRRFMHIRCYDNRKCDIINTLWSVAFPADSIVSTGNMQPWGSFGTSVSIYQSARRHIPDCNPKHYFVKLKARLEYNSWTRILSKISSFHSRDYEESRLLG